MQTGGLLLGLLQDPLMSKFVVVAGGAVVSALTGCDSGARLFLFHVFSVTVVVVPISAANVVSQATWTFSWWARQPATRRRS